MIEAFQKYRQGGREMELTHRLGCYELRGADTRPSASWKPRGANTYATAHIAEAIKFFDVADSKTRAKLKPHVEKLIADIAASTTLDGDVSKLHFPAGLTPRPYQAGGVNYALDRRSCLNADAPRLGKSVQSVLQANTLAFRLGNKLRWLIICPANAKIQWYREVNKWRTFTGSVKILQGTTDTFDADVVIMNWELVPYYGRELLNDLAFDFTTFDEAHRLRHLKSQTTTICLGKDLEDNSIGADPGGIKTVDRLFLTGTPIFTKPVNIWPLVRACDPNSLGRNFYDFGTRYCGAGRGRGVKFDPSGGTNLDELQIRMRRSFMVRRERRDVAGEIPSSFDPVVFPRDSFEQLLRKEASELRAQFSDDDRPLSQILADRGDAEVAHAASSYEALSLAKLPLCIEHITPQVEAGEKVVIFAHHRSVLFALKDAFPGCAFFPGGLTMTQRQYQVDRFREDDECRVMVAGITAAGEAISFAAANISFFVEIVYSHGAMEQAEERIVLPEKTDPLSTQFLIVEGSADEAFFEIRNTRRAEAKQAVDAHKLVLPKL